MAWNLRPVGGRRQVQNDGRTEEEDMRAKSEAPAMRRAQAVWGDAALSARREIRRRGLPVSSWLDNQAGRRRGDAVVKGLTRMSQELHDAGVPLEDIARAMTRATLAIVTAATQQDGPRAA